MEQIHDQYRVGDRARQAAAMTTRGTPQGSGIPERGPSSPTWPGSGSPNGTQRPRPPARPHSMCAGHSRTASRPSRHFPPITSNARMARSRESLPACHPQTACRPGSADQRAGGQRRLGRWLEGRLRSGDAPYAAHVERTRRMPARKPSSKEDSSGAPCHARIARPCCCGRCRLPKNSRTTISRSYSGSPKLTSGARIASVARRSRRFADAGRENEGMPGVW